MNQIKIGKFITWCRKERKLTQAELAELLGITDRAISKWETGKSFPDSSLILELCEILCIHVNELLIGEKIEMENYQKIAEETLLEMRRQEEETNRRLIKLHVIIGITCTVFFFIMIFAACYAVETMIWKCILIISASILFLQGIVFALRIEQSTGYYKCKYCNHYFKPSYSEVFLGIHFGTNRYMKCPTCQKKFWSRKYLSKE